MEKLFEKTLETFENDDIKAFAGICIASAPEYWRHVPASSTGKYHPAYSLGEGGLVRHTIAVVRILNHMFNVESISSQFTSRERDLLRVSALVHDMQKSGSQDEYEKSKYTKFDHPLLIARVIRNFKGDTDLPDDEIELVAHCIESHMGAWNTDKRNPGIILPKPTDKYQIALHLADYLASRKDIELKFDEPLESEPQSLPDIHEWKMNFGKYAGMTLPELEATHPDYIAWLQKQSEFDKEPCKSLLIKMGYKFND